MVFWQKPLTIPSCSKFDHRCGLHQTMWTSSVLYSIRTERVKSDHRCFCSLNFWFSSFGVTRSRLHYKHIALAKWWVRRSLKAVTKPMGGGVYSLYTHRRPWCNPDIQLQFFDSAHFSTTTATIRKETATWFEDEPHLLATLAVGGNRLQSWLLLLGQLVKNQQQPGSLTAQGAAHSRAGLLTLWTQWRRLLPGHLLWRWGPNSGSRGCQDGLGVAGPGPISFF